MFVAEAPASTNTIVVSEWDVATGSSLRELVLPVSPGEGDVQMVRAGDRIHFLAWHFNADLDYACVSTSLQVLHAERLGDVAATGPAAIASDGALTIVVADGVLGSTPRVGTGGQQGYFAVTFDAAGRRIASRVLERPHHEGLNGVEYSMGMHDNAVIVGGRAYVLLANGDASAPHLLQLRPDLSVERERSVRVPADSYPGALTLSLWPDRIGVDCPNPPLRILMSPSLEERSRGRPCPRAHAPGDSSLTPSRDVSMGRVHVALYTTGHGKAHLAWAEDDAHVSPDALCGSAP